MKTKQIILVIVMIAGLGIGGYTLWQKIKVENKKPNNIFQSSLPGQATTSNKENNGGIPSFRNILSDKPYEDKIIGFSIQYPKNWEIIGNSSAEEALYFSPDKTLSKAFIVFDLLYGSIKDSIKPISLDDYIGAAGEQMQIDRDTHLIFENYKFIKSETFILPNGKIAFLIEFNAGNKEKMQGFQVFVNQKLTDGSIRIFRLIALTPLAQWIQYRDTLSAALKTFTPLPPSKEWLNFLIFSRNSQRRAALSSMGLLEQYYIDNDHYPAKLDELVPKWLSKIPVDPLTGQAYEYKPNSSLSSYTLCANLEGQEKYCQYH